MDIKEVRDLAVKIAADSIKFPTVLGKAYEDIINYYEELLSNYGIHVTVHRVADDFVMKALKEEFRPDLPRYILLGRIGSGGEVLQFNGHYDVVAPGGGWTSEPFKPLITEGRIFGRGATDMKGGIAAFLAAMIYVAQRDEPDIVVEAALVPDEEIGGATGTGYLVNELGSRPNWVVIAEPSGVDNIYIGHKGSVWGIIKVHGRQAHGSAPWLGDNAFMKMVRYALEFYNEYSKALEGKKSAYEYEHPEAAKPTLNLGGLVMSAGSVNIVPGAAGFSIDRRLIVEERADEVEKEIVELTRKVSERLGIAADFELLDKSDPVSTAPDSEVVRALDTSITEVLGRSPRKTICVGGLDLKYYIRSGVPAVAYGPGKVGVAHVANEYIEIADLYSAVDVYVKLIEKLSGPRSP